MLTKEQIRQNKFFASLPKMMQEAVMMSDAEFRTEQDIRNFVENLKSEREGGQRGQR